MLFSCSVTSDSLWPHGLQHTRLPGPSLSPWVCLNSCPLNLWCHPTISSSCSPLLLLPSVFPSIRVCSSESALPIRWPRYWSFTFSISPYNEYSGLISFRIDWFDLLAVQGTLKSLLQHQFESINSSAFSLIYGPTLTSIHDCWKNHGFDYTDLVGKVISLLFSTLFRFVIAFPPRSKCLLVSWLQSPSTLILEPRKIVCHCFHCFPIYLPLSDGTRCHDLSFLNVEFTEKTNPLWPRNWLTYLVVQWLRIHWILSSNAGDAGSIPGLQTRIVCVAGQLSSQAARREKPMYHKERSCMLQLRPEAARTKVNR